MFYIFVLCGLASALSNRSIDPLITPIAHDFSLTVETAALISSAYAFPYAFSQPILGPIGDFYGKTRVLKACLWLLTACLVGCALAPDFGTLLTIRLIGGISAGGIMPVTMALMSDQYPPAQRQLAIGRFLTAGLTGMVFGASIAGWMAVTIGWRSYLWLAAAFAVAAAIGATAGLETPPRACKPGTHIRLADATSGYAAIFANPKARYCFATVFLEAVSLFGAMPFIGSLLETDHLGGAREAGLVLGAYGLGGIFYSATLPITLRLLRRSSMMALGGILAVFGLAGLALALPWPALAALMGVSGCGFFLLHNSIQAEVAELSATHRASAFSMHSFFFFLGQALGPIVCGAGLATFGRPWLIANILVFATTGLVMSRVFKRHPTASGRL